MIAFARALIILARQYRRIAKALEDLRDCYRIDLQARGLWPPVDPRLKDEVEVMYGPKTGQSDDPYSDFLS